MTMDLSITDTSRAVFLAYAKDAGNWNGSPLVGGNVGGSKAERGNLTQLKKAGLIETQVDEDDTWIYFTELGREYARELGVGYVDSWNW
jgi:predicted DNA-binding ArsR family transcriptional regulator